MYAEQSRVGIHEGRKFILLTNALWDEADPWIVSEVRFEDGESRAVRDEEEYEALIAVVCVSLEWSETWNDRSPYYVTVHYPNGETFRVKGDEYAPRCQCGTPKAPPLEVAQTSPTDRMKQIDRLLPGSPLPSLASVGLVDAPAF